MNLGMIRWNVELRYLPEEEEEGDDDDRPAAPAPEAVSVVVVRKWTKFSTVRGTISGRRVSRRVPRGVSL